VPDAILLDLKMPGLGGLGLLFRLRSNPRHAVIPVAIVTEDYVFTPSVEHAAELLKAEIHFKPLEVQAILDLTVRLIDSAAIN
jgi:CheY-like chemotaxis protein